MKSFSLIITAAMLLLVGGAIAQEMEGKPVKIMITSGDLSIEAVLNNSAPSQDLIKRLPVTLNFHQHQSREYYADIRLNKNDATQGGYQIGDIAYWAPGNSLVLFYGSGYTGSLINMGKMTSGINELSKMDGSIRIKIEKIED